MKEEKKNPIDWHEVHRRMEAVQSAIEQGLKPGKEKRAGILKARADILAKKSETPRDEETMEVVEFLLANEKYAIASEFVREICPLSELTTVPCTPRFVLGIINVRGEVISVIDMKKFFDLPEKGLTDLNKVIILESPEMEFGILADAIIGVRNISRNEIGSSLPTLTGIREEYLMGVTREREIVLDGAKLLSDKKIIVHEEIQE